MTIGSAASLAGTLPKAPLSPLPVARLDKGIAILPYGGSDFDAPPRIGSLQKGAGEPPRGHILVAAAESSTVLELQRVLAESGYRVVGPVASVAETNRLVERVHQPLSCGLIDVDLPDSESIADRLAVQSLPLVLLASTANAVLPSAHSGAPIARKPVVRDDLLEAIETSIRNRVCRGVYVVPPPQAAWPRIFPQL